MFKKLNFKESTADIETSICLFHKFPCSKTGLDRAEFLSGNYWGKSTSVEDISSILHSAHSITL